MSENTPEEDSGGLCCQGCSSTARKCGYYITFLLGLVIFGYGIVKLLFGQTIYMLVVGSLFVLFCPLWVKSCNACFSDFKNALKLTSFLIFVAFLAGTIACSFFENLNWITIFLGGCLGISGIWYFLSFFPGGQKGCIDCMKSCCCSDNKSSGN